MSLSAVSLRRRSTVGVALVGGLLVASLTGCSSALPDLDPKDASVVNACRIIVDELSQTGATVADLVPSDWTKVDGAMLSTTYDAAHSSLLRVTEHVEDVRVGDVLGVATEALGELAPIVEKASAGDLGAIKDAAKPASRLGAISVACVQALELKI